MKNELSQEELDILIGIPEEKRETAIRAVALYKSMMLNGEGISPLWVMSMLQSQPRINETESIMLETFKMEHQMLMMKLNQEFEFKIKIMENLEKLLESLIDAVQPMLNISKAVILKKGEE